MLFLFYLFVFCECSWFAWVLGLDDEVSTMNKCMEELPPILENLPQEVQDVANELLDRALRMFSNEVDQILNSVEQRAQKMMNQGFERADKLVDGAINRVEGIVNTNIGKVENILSRITDFAEKSIGDVEDIVEDALDTIGGIVDEVEGITDELVSNLWDLLHEVECITLSSVQYVEFIIFSILDAVGDADQVCRKHLKLTDQIIPTFDLYMQYQLLSCKMLYGLDEYTDMETIIVAHSMLAMKIRTFVCMSKSNPVLYDFFKQEYETIQTTADTYLMFIKELRNETKFQENAVFMKYRENFVAGEVRASEFYSVLDLQNTISDALPQNIRSVVDEGGSVLGLAMPLLMNITEQNTVATAVDKIAFVSYTIIGVAGVFLLLIVVVIVAIVCLLVILCFCAIGFAAIAVLCCSFFKAGEWINYCCFSHPHHLKEERHNQMMGEDFDFVESSRSRYSDNVHRRRRRSLEEQSEEEKSDQKRVPPNEPEIMVVDSTPQDDPDVELDEYVFVKTKATEEKKTEEEEEDSLLFPISQNSPTQKSELVKKESKRKMKKTEEEEEDFPVDVPSRDLERKESKRKKKD